MNSLNTADNETISKPGGLNEVLLGFGSNLGDRVSNIRSAINFLLESKSFTDVRISSFYESEPIGFTEQPWFINSAVYATTNLLPHELLKSIRLAEEQIGRIKREKWHEREIDIDILLMSDIIIDTDNLILPHPEMQKRRFVLLPASEIAPEMMHPVLNLTVSQLLTQCDDRSVVKKY